jgi:DtxR family Mn-dependent transcriptional regulator
METWKRFGEKQVSHSMAHYLQAVATLKDERGHARVGDIASHLGVTKSGVTSMMRSLQTRGLVTHEKYGCVELTASGRMFAERTEASRRVLELFLREILNVEEHVAVEDACMIEHLVNPRVSLGLYRLTSFMRSDHPAARAFREAFHAGHADPCAGPSGGACELCGVTCIGHSLAAGVAEAEPA